MLEKKGSWIAYNGEMIGQGREAAKQHLIDNPDVADQLTGLIMEKVHPKGGESLTGDSEPEAEEA